MTILYNPRIKEYQLPDKLSYDVDEKVYYSMSYRPRGWAANTEYIQGVDLIISATPNGLIYECSSGGISGVAEPTFSTVTKEKTADGSAEWKGRPYVLLLRTGDVVTTSDWIGVNGEAIDAKSIVGGIQTKCRLIGVPSGATEAKLLNKITVTRANGDIEEFDSTLIIPIKTH